MGKSKKKPKKASAPVGRPRKYETAKELSDAVDDYFASISYTETIHGCKVTRYVTTPSEAALQLHLHITDQTWRNYRDNEELKFVWEQTRQRMIAFCVNCLNGKGAQGAKFRLSSCYGWREKVDVTGDGLVKVNMALPEGAAE